MIWEISPWLKFKILGVFVNTVTADDKYPVRDAENLQFPIQIQLSQKRKTFFSVFFFPVLECSSYFKHFLKKIIVTANVFPKLETVKVLVRPLSK